MYVLPQPHKCLKCGYECQVGPHDDHGAPWVAKWPVCPKCWDVFLAKNVGLMQNLTFPRSLPPEHE